MKGAKKLGLGIGNWVLAKEARALWLSPEPKPRKQRLSTGIYHLLQRTDELPATPAFFRHLCNFCSVVDIRICEVAKMCDKKDSYGYEWLWCAKIPSGSHLTEMLALICWASLR